MPIPMTAAPSPQADGRTAARLVAGIAGLVILPLLCAAAREAGWPAAILLLSVGAIIALSRSDPA
jgi:hypothetical protein